MDILQKLKTFLKNPTHHYDVPLSGAISHQRWQQTVVDLCDKPGAEVLEVGSREVVSAGLRKFFKHANYTGFDYYPGNNVDVVGDAHCLSQHFDKKFDLIFSTAVFEHFAMPWKVASEMAKLLNVGGYVFVETHYSFSSHERPWHFFQFSEEALKVLFSPALGFECVEAGVCNPIFGFFSPMAVEYLRYRKVTGLYCHSEYLGRKVRDVEDFSWDTAQTGDVVTHKYRLPG